MRCTAASSVVVASVLLAALSQMPVVPEGPGAPPAIAQEEAAKPEAIASSNPGDESVEQKAIAVLDRKLSQAVKVDFNDIPLREAIEKLAERIEADVIFDEQEIKEEGLTIDSQVSLKLEHTPVTARAALELMLKPHALAFTNHSGVLLITTRSGAAVLLTIKVYNARDLVEQAASNYTTPKRGGGPDPNFNGSMDPNLGGGSFFSIQDQLAAGAMAAELAQMGGMGTGMVPFSAPGSPEQQAMMALIQLIQQTTSGPWFNTEGTGGSMMPFDGLIVVRQSGETHHEIQTLLDGLRAANQSGPGSSVTVPKGTAPAEQQTQSDPGLPNLSILGEYDVTPDARTMLIEMQPDESGKISQLEALRAVTLTQLPRHSGKVGGLPATMAYNLIVPLGIQMETWQAAINRAKAHDKPLPALKIILDRAKNHAGGQPIDAEHLLFALMDYGENGPISAVLASVGLTPERLRKRITGPAQGTDVIGTPFGAAPQSENGKNKEE